MQWQFKVLSGSGVASTARILWTVDYKKNGLSRNAYFSPEGSRIVAKFNVAAGHIDNIVAVLKVTREVTVILTVVSVVMFANTVFVELGLQGDSLNKE